MQFTSQQSNRYHYTPLQKIDEHFHSLGDSTRYCLKLMAEADLCVQAIPYANPNNIYMSLQQGYHSQIFSILQQVQSTNVVLQERKTLIQQFRSVALKLNEFGQQTSREPLESLSNRLVEEVSKVFLTKKLVVVPPMIMCGKENNYFSQKPTTLELPSAQVTPLSSNRTYLFKQNSLTVPDNPKSVSPKRISPSPLRQRNDLQNPLVCTQGNKSLMLNQLAKTHRAHETTIKPLKKYQIDFPVAAIEVISDSLFALTSCNDPFLRIFDTVMKRIHTLQAHSSPITGMDKSHAPNPCHSKKPSTHRSTTQSQKYIFTLSVDSFVVWVFENSSVGTQLAAVPQIFFKLKCPDQVKKLCYLQDGNNVAFGDSTGVISIYNFMTQKFQFNQLERQHSKGVLSMSYVAKSKKLVVLGEDQKISVWRLTYSCYPRQQQLESIKVEQVIANLELGTVRVIQPLYSDSDLIFIGNEEGSIKLVNLVTEKIEAETNQYSFPVVDMNIAEETNTEESSYCVMALSTQMKSLRLWRLQKGQRWTHTESRVEVAMQLGENLSRSKMQFVQLYNSSYYVLIANEIGRELLVYEVTSK